MQCSECVQSQGPLLRWRLEEPGRKHYWGQPVKVSASCRISMSSLHEHSGFKQLGVKNRGAETAKLQSTKR